MKEIKLQAPDISCNHCAMTIKRELTAVQGVVVEDVDVPSKTITLSYENAEALAQAKALLDEIGYPVAS